MLNQAIPKTRISLTDKEVAEALGMSLAFVRKDRATNRILPFYRIGAAIRYDIDVIRRQLLNSMEGGI